jgi:dipeptidyl aminopeptidase/acylaminoacyl peptidase
MKLFFPLWMHSTPFNYNERSMAGKVYAVVDLNSKPSDGSAKAALIV